MNGPLNTEPGGAVEISVVIPVLHEGAAILDTLRSLAAAAVGVSYEVIVVDGDGAGSTIAHLADFQGLPSVPVHTVVTTPGRGGQLNRGAAIARGRLLLFLHSDARLPDHALADLIKNLPADSAQPAAAAFNLAIASPEPALQLIATVASWRSRLTRIPYGDQGHCVRRAVFEAIGGYPPWPIMEDVGLMQTLKRRGDRLVILPPAIAVSPRRWQREGVVRCTVRNWLLLGLYYAGVSPSRLAAWYRPERPKAS